MSATLNFNQVPYFSWKNKTLNQITSVLQENKNTLVTNSPNVVGDIYFRAGPIKLYRREIFSETIKSGNPRISVSIDELNMPNGYFISNLTDCSNQGQVQYLDPKEANITTNLYEMGEICNTCNLPQQCDSTSTTKTYISEEFNARRRVRSAGMVTRKYNENSNNDTYNTSNRQYLTSRNRTYKQNQYNYIRQGNALAIPGDNLSVGNVYSANGVNHCANYYFSHVLDNNTFSYIWVDGNIYQVTIPDGFYNVTTFQSVFQDIMTQHTHYYVNIFNQVKEFLLQFAFNSFYNTIEIQSYVIPSALEYIQPVGSVWIPVVGITNPQIVVENNAFTGAIGFATGTYPVTNTGNTATVVTQSQPTIAGLLPQYTPVIYKPNNSQFAVQGAVDSSERLARLKYDTITTVGASYRRAFGPQVANALAYGVPAGGYQYTLKDVIGYPLTKFPVINKYSGELKCCIKPSGRPFEY